MIRPKDIVFASLFYLVGVGTGLIIFDSHECKVVEIAEIVEIAEGQSPQTESTLCGNCSKGKIQVLARHHLEHNYYGFTDEEWPGTWQDVQDHNIRWIVEDTVITDTRCKDTTIKTINIIQTKKELK